MGIEEMFRDCKTGGYNADTVSFGRSLAPFSGSNLLVGEERGGTGFSGSAYLFDTATTTVSQTFNSPSPSLLDEFGSALASIGNTVIIGAPGDDTGAPGSGVVYLFDSTTGVLTRTIANPTPNI